MNLIVQIAGSLLVLAGFALAQKRIINPNSRSYLLLNTVGSAVLAANAVFERQWGFLLLEGIWALISAWSLTRVLAKRSGGADADDA